MSDTTNPSTQSDDNDIDLMSLFDTFYDAPESPSPGQEPDMSPVQTQRRHSNADCPPSGFQALETLVADLGSLVTEVEALAKDFRADFKAPVIDDEARAIDTQAAYQTSATVVAYILGKDRAFQMLRVASDNHILGTGNDIDTSSIDKAGPAAERRQSTSNAGDVKYDHHAYLRNAENHDTNTLSQDINLSAQIHDALLDEKQTGKALLAAKARVKAVWHIWEAKMKRDEIAELDKKYDHLRAEYGKLEDEAAVVAVQLAAKRCEAREWKIMAYEEDWQGIFDDDVDKE
ncbi:hypothetical protein FPANT_4008 [Fusarium pseudoanthophilum]|uniref:Uncharacterized protein n=1 Tax=Fusarium pseudoanthophilum TaxID=48495 RepID=A0A8H5USP4_9HYPO|nr:hypothetical protein FPANT_4008 [Fusarium pseudoanthophilum]